MLSAQYGVFAKGEVFRRLRERLLSGTRTAQKKVTGKVISFKQALVAAEGADKARRAQIRPDQCCWGARRQAEVPLPARGHDCPHGA